MKLWQHLLHKLEENRKAYLLTVIENFGSSPGRKGFKMIVVDDGFIFGSIGGGVMEHALVEETKKLLTLADMPIFLRKQIHKGKIKDGSGMICSGEQTVVFHPLNATHISDVKRIIDCLKLDKKGTLLLSHTSFSFSYKEMKKQFDNQIVSTKEWSFKEQIGFKNRLYIVGAGHVSLAVSDLFSNLGFYVTIFDNRQNLNTFDLNTSAHQKRMIDYNQISDYILEGDATYVTIMTNTYLDDKLVLSKILKNTFKYVGVLGSTAKLKTMWEVLQQEGFTPKQLSTIKAPIGLSIKSQTPEEIAVSIAAEVIQLKNVNA
ncbi:XdhC family protein [Flavobacteriaceae bacterium S356]|uniref:XdhC family protein n=1 Tax=Asprobacillus argus TaxID=3076534 RepID=A0ABU3LGT6_9FLAO|nr:XdhC family protein [Flavobacteriaceae bacterium S356]